MTMTLSRDGAGSDVVTVDAVSVENQIEMTILSAWTTLQRGDDGQVVDLPHLIARAAAQIKHLPDHGARTCYWRRIHELNLELKRRLEEFLRQVEDILGTQVPQSLTGRPQCRPLELADDLLTALRSHVSPSSHSYEELEIPALVARYGNLSGRWQQRTRALAQAIETERKRKVQERKERHQKNRELRGDKDRAGKAVSGGPQNGRSSTSNRKGSKQKSRRK